MKLLITGGSGYVGAMLVDVFASRDDVEKVLVVDKDPLPELLKTHKNKDKIEFFQGNLADDRWQEPAGNFLPDVIVHTAWQIRAMYGKRSTQHDWNIGGSDDVFEFAFNFPSVKKLIHFSTVASYGAYPSNTVDHFFTEDEPFRLSDYLYAEEKRVVEEILREKYEAAKKEGKRTPSIFIIRPASITGPRGRNDRESFGLQSALSGKLANSKSLLYKLISFSVSLVPVTPKWLRQYVHEDDIAGAVTLFATTEAKSGYDAFNLAPEGDVVLGKDMAEAVGKKVLVVYPWMVRLAFFFVWHLTLGRIPTARGVWKGYSFPIPIDGSKISKKYGFKYSYSPKEAFTTQKGKYGK